MQTCSNTKLDETGIMEKENHPRTRPSASRGSSARREGGGGVEVCSALNEQKRSALVAVASSFCSETKARKLRYHAGLSKECTGYRNFFSSCLSLRCVVFVLNELLVGILSPLIPISLPLPSITLGVLSVLDLR